MIGAMATRVMNENMCLSDTTEFVLHKSQQTIFHGIQKKILDYSEHRLIYCICTVNDSQQRMMLVALLDDYRKGKVAIAWRHGRPVHFKVTKST